MYVPRAGHVVWKYPISVPVRVAPWSAPGCRGPSTALAACRVPRKPLASEATVVDPVDRMLRVYGAEGCHGDQG
jgi:hypothetical protein